MHKFPSLPVLSISKTSYWLNKDTVRSESLEAYLVPIVSLGHPEDVNFSESWFHHLNTGAGVGGSEMLFSKAVLVLLESVSLRNISRRTPTTPEMSQGRSLLSYTHLPNLRDGLPSAFFSLLFLSPGFITWNGSKAMDLCACTEPFSHPSIRAARAVMDYKRRTYLLILSQLSSALCLRLLCSVSVFMPSVLAAPESSDLHTHC